MMKLLDHATNNPLVTRVGLAIAAPTEVEEELVQIDGELLKLRQDFERTTLQRKPAYVFFPLFF